MQSCRLVSEGGGRDGKGEGGRVRVSTSLNKSEHQLKEDGENPPTSSLARLTYSVVQGDVRDVDIRPLLGGVQILQGVAFDAGGDCAAHYLALDGSAKHCAQDLHRHPCNMREAWKDCVNTKD